ncbi:MAG: YceI family protein [Bacteroidia bacterium]
MKKALFILTLSLLVAAPTFAQKLITKTASVKFYSHTPVEDIEANNIQVLSVLNTENGQVAFSMLMKSFEFDKALMQEHFNEKYVESSQFPKATFKGKITNLSEINFKKDGTYEAKVTGTMTIHGESQEVTTTGTITVKKGTISLSSKFNVSPGDYAITIPGVVAEKISKEIEVTVNAEYKN